MQCDRCNKQIDPEQENDWVVFDLQKGYEELHMCSADCVRSWVNGKIAGMVFSLILGVIISVSFMFDTIGMGAWMFVFVPYMVRQAYNSLKGTHEFWWFFIPLLGSITFIYPVYKLIQEIRDYSQIRKALP